MQKLFVSNFERSRPELLSLCCTGLLMYWEVLTVLPICRTIYSKLPRTSCNKSIAEAVLMFRLLQAIIINQMRSWSLRVNIRHNLLMVGLNITNMHATLTPPGVELTTFDLSRTVYYHDTPPPMVAGGRREGVCRPGQTSVLPSPPIKSVLQSGYFSGFRTSGCELTFEVPSSSLPSYFLLFPLLSPPITLLLFTPSHTLR